MQSQALYDSDLTDAQLALIRPLVPPHPPRGNLPWISKREIMNAIFYVDKQGCTWRGMPHDFPAWQTVYDYFREWTNAGAWNKSTIRSAAQYASRREKIPNPRRTVDRQSVKTTLVPPVKSGHWNASSETTQAWEIPAWRTRKYGAGH